LIGVPSGCMKLDASSQQSRAMRVICAACTFCPPESNPPTAMYV
jgi:hypothetical protein